MKFNCSSIKNISVCIKKTTYATHWEYLSESDAFFAWLRTKIKRSIAAEVKLMNYSKRGPFIFSLVRAGGLSFVEGLSCGKSKTKIFG